MFKIRKLEGLLRSLIFMEMNLQGIQCTDNLNLTYIRRFRRPGCQMDPLRMSSLGCATDRKSFLFDSILVFGIIILIIPTITKHLTMGRKQEYYNKTKLPYKTVKVK